MLYFWKKKREKSPQRWGSGVARGESWGTRPGAQALGAHQPIFAVNYKPILSRNFKQTKICSKMGIFW